MTEAPRRFVLLMPWGRVGSNLVAATLGRRPDIRIDNEPTTRIRTYGERDGVSTQDQAKRQLAELETFLAATADTAETRAAGLKLSFRSLLEPRVYLFRLRTANVPLVLMTRQNHLKSAVSQLRARARAEAEDVPWQSPWAVRAKEPKPGPVALDPDEVIRLTKLFRQLHHETLKTVRAVYGDDWIIVEYDHLAANPEAEIGRICDWIGLARFDTADLPYRKATSDDLSEDVTNYKALARAAREAGFGQMLAGAPR